MLSHDLRFAEWLETDGLGGFSSGTASGIRTRRYHSLLLSATTPPTGRFMLVNDIEVWVDTPEGTYSLSSQAYRGDVIHPDGESRIESFAHDPWPRWVYRLEDGTVIEKELFMIHGSPIVAVSFRIIGRKKDVTMGIRPMLSGRSAHSLHHENKDFNSTSTVSGEQVTWNPYASVPGITAFTNGRYADGLEWYRHFRYDQERARGYDYEEDLASPGTFTFDLSKQPAIMILAARGGEGEIGKDGETVEHWFDDLRDAEKRRRKKLAAPLDRAADDYIVRRGSGRTILAGYPWFTDWGRDTFISMRGLCHATGRLDDARTILMQWTGVISQGMLPNRFTEEADTPEYNSVDAALWFVIAAYEYQNAVKQHRRKLSKSDADALKKATLEILAGHAAGSRHGIRVDDDGLLAAGEPGVQLTWMDAKVGDWVVTPRIGKPVEIQALWINALRIGSDLDPTWRELHAKARESFRSRFWNAEKRCLFDVVDNFHRKGDVDASFRPNQIFAVGGLPFTLVDGDIARAVVDAVDLRLRTPLGLRSLAPDESAYAPRYEGNTLARDGAYHQGTVWTWLMGPFVEAWVRVRGGTAEAKRQAREMFLDPLLQHMNTIGLGHLCEIADGDPPHTPRGCPFQAWSVGEALRLDRVVLAVEEGIAEK